MIDTHDVLASQALPRTSILNRGDLLFEAGTPATSLYVVRSGAISTSLTNGYGAQQILSFSLGGDLIGVSGLHDDVHQGTARAVQRTSMCEFPLDLLHQLSDDNGRLVRFLRRALSKEVKQNRQARLQLATPRADTRVASFLMWYAEVLAARGLSIRRFRLAMSRAQIANHLGLTVESISRAFADLRAEGMLGTHGREVGILDVQRLQELADSKQLRRVAPEPPQDLSPAVELLDLRADSVAEWVTGVPEGLPFPCARCVRSNNCVPSVIDTDDVLASQALPRTFILNRGDLLFEAGRQATSLYVVRSGAISTSLTNGYGAQQILSFSLGGDLIGASGLHNDVHQGTARAVQRTSVCEFPLDLLHQLSDDNGRLVRFLRRALSKEVKRNRQARLQLATPRADIRVASFLMWYVEVLAARGLSIRRFRLPMSRAQIANHLVLTAESISRAFADLRAEGVLGTHGKELEVLDLPRLQELADCKQLRRVASEPPLDFSPVNTTASPVRSPTVDTC